MAEVSDAELIARSKDDPEAFGPIFDRHGATILRYLVRRVGRSTAEGLLGEVFRIAFEKRASFDPAREASVRPWLYGIATNLQRRHHRTQARRLRATAALAADRALELREGSPWADAAEARLLLPRVADAVAALPEGERDALLLFAWEDLGYQEIATALGIPVGTVRSRLNRARARLRELRPRSGEEEEKGAERRRVRP